MSTLFAALITICLYLVILPSNTNTSSAVIFAIIVYVVSLVLIIKIRDAVEDKFEDIVDDATEKFRQNSGYGNTTSRSSYNSPSRQYSSTSSHSSYIPTLGDGSLIKTYENNKKKEVKTAGYTWEQLQQIKEFNGNISEDYWRCGNCKRTNNNLRDKCEFCGLSKISSDALIVRNYKKLDEEKLKKAEEQKAQQDAEPYAWYYDHNGKIFYADRLGRAHYPDPALVEESVPASEPEQIYEPEPISEQQQTFEPEPVSEPLQANAPEQVSEPLQTFEPEPVSEPLQTYEYITAYEPQQTNMPEQATTPTETEQSQQEERPQLMFCPFCGNPAGAGQNFCAYCGSDISPYFNH